MKETIYTIPINEAFDKECSCALCAIQNKIESDEVNYTLGAAMMEPDYRQVTNDKGFCREHIRMIHKQQKALPMALVLQSYTEVQNKNIISKLNKTHEKKSLFKSNPSKKLSALDVVAYIDEQQHKCAICDELEHQMTRYAENTVDMWKSMPEFKNY